MFLARRPSAAAIERFLEGSRNRSLSYQPVGLVRQTPVHERFDEEVAVIGHGDHDFERARAALAAWKQFDMGWVETFPKDAPIIVGTVVAVLIRHLGFWSLNGCRVVYPADSWKDIRNFGFAYGTLTNHAENGEELFEVFIDPRRGDVMYRIRAMSWPQATLARIGQPIVRMLQARFRRDSVAAMRRATRRAGRAPLEPSFRYTRPVTSDWPETLDALVAAPGQHRLLFENAHVRVLDTHIAPGERTPVHTHCWPAGLYILSWSDFVRRDENGVVLLDTRTAGVSHRPADAIWGDALAPHSLENVGSAPLHIICTELKAL